MTQLGLDYLKHQEQRRSNLATEVETNRANVAKEAENLRHNTATEQQAREELGETNRHNVRTENLEDIKNQATQEHYERQDAETKRANLAKEKENNRANVAKEKENYRANTAKELMDSLKGLEGGSAAQQAEFIRRNNVRLKEAGLSDDQIRSIAHSMDSAIGQRRWFDRVWNLLSSVAGSAGSAAAKLLTKK